MKTDEIITADLFCGAGGSSYGASQALKAIGLSSTIVAVNHWDVAIATHQANLPETQHHCTNLDLVRPVDLVPGGHLDMLWASPECTHFSRAGGIRPLNDQQRMSAWLINRWLTDLDVTRLIVENVPEFVTWGPLCRHQRGHEGHHRAGGSNPDKTACGRPLPNKKGSYFEAWYKSLRALGYKVDWRYICAADHGDPTTRTRFFLQARKDRHRILWPEATHAPRNKIQPSLFGTLKPYVPAAEVLNLSNRGKSIFGRKKPLSLNTLLRIARGAHKFWGELAPWYVAMLDLSNHPQAKAPGPNATKKQLARHQARMAAITKITLGQLDTPPVDTSLHPFVVILRENNVAKSLDDPLGTITCMPGMRLIQPGIEPFVFGNRSHSEPRSPQDPIPTETTATGGGIALASGAFALSQNGGGEARSTDEPLPTIVTGGAISVTTPSVLEYHGRADIPKAVSETLGAVTTKQGLGLAHPILLTLRGTSADQLNSTATPLSDPLGTVSAGGRHHGVARAFIASAGGPTVEARAIDEPAPAILTKDRLAFITPNFGERLDQAPRIHDLKEPIPTVTANDKLHLVSADGLLVAIDQSNMAGQGVRSTSDPTPTIVTKQNIAVASPLLLQMAHVGRTDSGTAKPTAEPAPTITGRINLALASPELQAWADQLDIDPRRLALYSEDGINFYLVIGDIFFRMVENPELAGAQGFPKTYIFRGTKTQITKQIGNAVPTNTAGAITTSAFHDRMPKAA